MNELEIEELRNQAISENKDFYKLIASKKFGVDYDKVTERLRNIIKILMFQYSYSPLN